MESQTESDQYDKWLSWLHDGLEVTGDIPDAIWTHEPSAFCGVSEYHSVIGCAQFDAECNG